SKEPGSLPCLARSRSGYFTLMSCEVTVLVNGFAVKRITALTFVSGRFGSPPLDPVDPLDPELCELEPAGAPVERYAVTCTSHENITAEVSWKRTVRAPL